MTSQELEWFSELAADRAESARVFMKPSNIGVWRAIIDKYSDQAHFIYELLQNADDAGATKAEFKLDGERLLFKHNGTRRFSITSPKTEAEDFAKGKIGDLNSITGAGGFSTKLSENANGNAIGKFGVGFKAVFQYTTSPEIYDDNMAFRLEHYMVPVLIKADMPWRAKGETLFVFPLDRGSDNRARAEIWKKLNTLVFPTLFLNNLQEIKFSDGTTDGEYRIYVRSHCDCKDFEAKKIAAKSKTADGSKVETLWLFTRCDELHNRYCIGYMIDGIGKLKPVDYKAFCYFPTKHDTKLKFMIHAPFLLNDSRESIKDGQDHNFDMIAKLAQLATAGLKFLCERQAEGKRRIVDDDVVKVIPINIEDYGDGISFDQFRREFKYLFAKEQVVPTKDGCTYREDAYWPESFALAKLFSDEQLNDVIGRKNPWYPDGDKNENPMHWVFASFPKERRSNNQLDAYIYDFISGCASAVITDKEMIASITGEFIEKQKHEWLNDLYQWIAGNEQRMDAAKKIPIFLDHNGKSCAAFGDDGRKNLFLPLEGETRYHFIDAQLFKTNPSYKKIIRYYELEQPSMADYVELIIREKLSQATPEESDKYFKQIFQHYLTLSLDERCFFANNLKGRIRLRCTDSYNGEVQDMFSNQLYFPTEEIKAYFDGFYQVVTGDDGCEDQKKGVGLIDLQHYTEIAGDKYRKELDAFFYNAGVKELPEVIERRALFYTDELYKLSAKFSYCTERKKDQESYKIRCVLGGASFLNRINSEKDFGKKKTLSTLFWRFLCGCALEYPYSGCSRAIEGSSLNFLSGTHVYEYYGRNQEAFDSPFLVKLRDTPWLVIDDWTVKSPSETAVSEIPDCYKEVDGTRDLIEALKIRAYTNNDIEYQKKMEAREALSEEDREKLERGEMVDRYAKNLTDEEIEDALRKATFEKERATKLDNRSNNERQVDNSDDLKDIERTELDFEFSDNEQPTVKKPTQGSVMANIERKVEKLKVNAPSQIQKVLLEDEEDGDEITPKTIDFEKRIRDRELKQANEIAALERGDELQKAALSQPKYSLGWFKAMLGLEMLGMEEDSSSQREITVSFSKMVKEPDSERTYTLKHPSRNLPQWIEELSDVPLDMLVGRRSLRPRIEAMSVKSFDLRIKFKQDEKLDGVDLRELKEAKISVQRPDFLLNSLRDGLSLLPFEDGKNLHDDLAEQIEFVFGPPGTGKTTFLADKRIKNLMYREPGLKVLVLTPTNKAADVLAGREVTCMTEEESCKPWLVRFGATGDEFLEKSGIVCGKNVDIGKMERCCVVATIARFPYDKYVPGNAEPTKIEEVDWDYIIIDEASMIPLVYMVYVLYRKPKSKFIIAGDPFQIDPIVRNAAWEGENIYTMVGLNNFTMPTTSPRAYPVKKLTTQYRSLPCIGDIFSRYRYGGVLEHARTMDEDGNLRLPGLGIDKLPPLSIVKFPVSNYESIYSLKRLKYGKNAGSPYQIYSAIFTFELVCAIARRRAREMNGKVFRIGIISPYKSQADLVQRLIESEDIPLDAEISAGTVHGFQGDECDMIVALFNPPPGIAGGRRSFVNRVNIVNVAVSRARDYLVLVMPDDDTPKIENMFEVRKIEAAMRDANPKALVINARRLEKWMFGSETYIEDNSFSSGHQSVNVYGDPERRYEIRSEEAAIDIQIHNPPAKESAKIVPAQRPIVKRDDDFFSFLRKRAVLSMATMKAKEYRARYYSYRDIKESGDARATASAYQIMRSAAGFFYSHYNDYRQVHKSVPPFNAIMREVVRRLNENIPLW